MERSLIMIVDDSLQGVSHLQQHIDLEEVHYCAESDPQRAFDSIIEQSPDLVIVDLAYAGVESWALIDRIRRTKAIADLPVVMVTGLADVELRIKAFEMGADDVVQKPYNKAELRAMIRNVMKLNRFRKLAEQRNEIAHAFNKVQHAYDMTIQGWVKALDLRDQETEGHSLRVAEMTMRLAKYLQVDQSHFPHIWRGALLHDIGKLAVPDSILKKPGALTMDERRIIEKHPMHAHEMLYPIEYLRAALPIPVYHHEKWDGTGYPFHLSGESIPFEARAFALVDVWDALSFDRPYRKALSQATVRSHILAESGKHFQPELVEKFLELLAMMDAEGSIPTAA